uniref:Putative secreted peptide n=1 Tax=Anopheles braziliensis TaxID=58242 RepID=A0A2M3ZNW0_9DIPT
MMSSSSSSLPMSLRFSGCLLGAPSTWSTPDKQKVKTQIQVERCVVKMAYHHHHHHHHHRQQQPQVNGEQV